MSWIIFIFYIFGCVLAAYWCYTMIIKEKDGLNIKDILEMTLIIALSWLSDVIILFNTYSFWELIEKLDDLLSTEVIKFNRKEKDK